MKNIKIQDSIINIKDDYISLTDMAKYKDVYKTGHVILKWLSTKYAIQFIGIWEQMCNKNFNVTEFGNIKNKSGDNDFVLSVSQWIKSTNSIGIRVSNGRYGGTFAHKDIAFEFATWLSPEFKLYLIKEFQRLKEDETEIKNLDWNVKRALTKINYKIHTNSIQENIIIPHKVTRDQIYMTYAHEADMLNIALFGINAREWKLNNKGKDGNMRDYANVSQLICLSNLEVLNSEFIKSNMSQSDRLIRLNEIAIDQMQLLSTKSLKSDIIINL